MSLQRVKAPRSYRSKNSFLDFALPDLDEAEFLAVREVLESGWITTGPRTRDFETAFAEAVGARYAIAVNSCTAAMHLALEAVGVRKGDEVVTTPYTFAATSGVIRYLDARPVFVDVDEKTLNLNPDLVEAVTTRKTKAIVPVDVAGCPAELEKILEIGGERNIPVIEDAAHAFPASYKGKMIGSVSDITAFSFYATKTLTTGEGGMICTDNSKWADRCRIMSLHGISKDAWKRYTAEGSWYYEIVAPGYKYNLTDIAAAIGLVQLRKAESMLARRQQIAGRYNEAFAATPQLQIPYFQPGSQHAWYLYMLRLNLGSLRIDRALFMNKLKQRNIGTSVHFIPLHIHPYYCDLYGYSPKDFPVAYHEYLREISLPIYSKMSDDDVDAVIEAVIDVAKQNVR